MRQTGILLPIFSLPSRYGIGNFGREAYRFVDFLKSAGQSVWQILPLTETSFGDSPYQSPSAFAGNPYFIDPDALVEEGFAAKEDLSLLSDSPDAVDYGALYGERYAFLRRAYAGFLKKIPADFCDFCRKNADWLDDYALFRAIKDANGGAPFLEWDRPTLHRENLAALCEKYADEMGFYRFLQYEFDRQWQKLHAYAGKNGITVIGDLPIYVAMDSADVWANPLDFRLNDDLRPTLVAGVPPDAFSEEGQLWGNPLYDWERMAEEGFPWWKRRLKRALSLYDRVRIDHFVGFSTHYVIPASSTNAKCGMILRGPGYEFFRVACEGLPKDCIIAEDLGTLQEGVEELLSATGFPGMKVMQFSLDGGEKNPHRLPHHTENCVVYSGTHDNQTSAAFWRSLPLSVRRAACKLMPKGFADPADRMIAYAMQSPARLVVIPLGDYMRLGEEGRINAPATASGNWRFRLPKSYGTAALRARIIRLSGMKG